jgi:RNA polymerase sigma-70 factor, ECF subfamily
MAVSDEALVDLLSRSAKGDSVALRTLYDHTAPQLFSVVRRILQKNDLAEEALQDVFVSIWRNAALFNTKRGRPMTWMIGIARYRAIDLRRKRKHDQANQEISEVQDTLAAETVELADQATLLSDTRKLAECMGRLSDQQDVCIRLAFLDGLSHDEIATKLTSPIGTVKSWIRRGLRVLKDCLAV